MNPSEISSKTALIVDDEDQLLRLMVRVLEGARYRVWAAKDGIEAMNLFREHAADIDLALIDVMHPPGAGAADLLPKMLAERPDLDVILISGDALPEALEGELTSIGGSFLRKPFAPKALLRLLEGVGGSAEAPPDPPPGPLPGPGIV